ncbi:uncharacterized protein MYCFIDRAFT_80823 [Pseudocercospora fijiensis CIRAD86]|uniref:F-box domain-containing protein n=1 Tax=Pseudocercospora fijiensis (strain CIRAD86) TaxID=383855 RepID=M3A1Y4_PSEFD|nr:uncharacterized protein MYCFIDRAFT_80823 [Pseudocercospora fijiensis CIRAD86]EME78406.1 hypothetical protein MYCFIDRAFT_80823 [Pseudocercospora fijiensis CIRAD86]
MLSSIRQYLSSRQRAKPSTMPVVEKRYQTPPEATVEDLPTELLAEVMGHYSPVPRDYRTLCLVNKHFNAVATPFLYSQFSNLTSSTRLRLLLRTITQEPGLARHLRQLNIKLWLGAADDLPSTKEVIGYLEAILPYAAWRDVHYPLSTSLRNAVYDAQVMLLLLLAKNTQTLHFYLPSPQEASKFGGISPKYASLGTMLPLFQVLALEQQIPSILPELKSLHVRNQYDSMAIGGISTMLWESLQRHRSSLQHLKLVFRAEAAKCITDRPALRSLDEFSTLETLCIDDYALAGALQGEYVDQWEVDDLFKDRTSFLPQNLKTFVLHTRKDLIDSSSVMAQIHHMLPESLEHLTVTFTDLVPSYYRDLAYTLKPELPNLMRTICRRGICYSPHNSWVVECWKGENQSIKQGLVEYEMQLIDGTPMEEDEDEVTAQG